MMNLLIEKFPEFLIVNGVECPVKWQGAVKEEIPAEDRRGQ